MNKAVVLLAALALLSACMPPQSTVNTVVLKQKAPTIQYQAPAKQVLASVEWDFPRLATMSSITNSQKCIDAAKALNMDREGVYPTGDLEENLPASCATPAADQGSNLYIGLTEANFRNLVNNYNILLMREKRWQELLKNINAYLAVQGADNQEAPEKKEVK